MKRFTLIKKAPPDNYALESTRPPSGGRVFPYSDVGDGVPTSHALSFRAGDRVTGVGIHVPLCGGARAPRPTACVAMLRRGRRPDVPCPVIPSQ